MCCKGFQIPYELTTDIVLMIKYFDFIQGDDACLNIPKVFILQFIGNRTFLISNFNFICQYFLLSWTTGRLQQVLSLYKLPLINFNLQNFSKIN